MRSINWTGEISDTRGIRIAIDGKGLRIAAHKTRNERTSYVLNAIDTASELMIAQMAIQEKTSEAAATPDIMELIEMAGSIVAIDAAGATANIYGSDRENGGDFVPQIKRNCPALYDELMKLFGGLAEEREANAIGFGPVLNPS